MRILMMTFIYFLHNPIILNSNTPDYSNSPRTTFLVNPTIFHFLSISGFIFLVTFSLSFSLFLFFTLLKYKVIINRLMDKKLSMAVGESSSIAADIHLVSFNLLHFNLFNISIIQFCLPYILYLYTYMYIYRCTVLQKSASYST